MNNERPAVTVERLRRMKAAGERIACLTGYDASFGRLLDEAGVDLILVGDSLGMLVGGLAGKSEHHRPRAGHHHAAAATHHHTR